MGRRALTSWIRRRRFARQAIGPGDTRGLRHRPLVERLVREHLDPLACRLRRRGVEDLVRHILELEPSPVPLIDLPPAEQLLVLALRVTQAIERLEQEGQDLARDFANFDRLYATVDGGRERVQLVADYLRDTVRDRRMLAGDLRALDRYLGHDVIRERHLAARGELERTAELALDFLGRVSGALVELDAPPRELARVRVRELVEHVRLDSFLLEQLGLTARWQNRRAVLTALAEFERHRAALGVVSPATGAVHATAVAVARDPSEHPWVQAAALELLLGVDQNRAIEVFHERVLTPPADAPRTDFLFRAIAIDLVARELTGSMRVRLLRAVSLCDEPSDHVRMSLARALEGVPEPDALALLGRLAGLDPDRREPSPKVRAQAIRCACRRASALAADDAGGNVGAAGPIGKTLALVALALKPDEDPLVLMLGAQEIERTVAALVASRHVSLVEAHAPALTVALNRLLVDPQVSARVHAQCAAAREGLFRERDAARRTLTERLGVIARGIPLGESRRVSWAAEGVPANEVDATMIGRVLADLTRRDWGLFVDLEPKGLTLHRGDRFRRRLWRVLHEIRRPSPMKRQGWRHTVGRVARGTIRAHPAGLDEVTETTVPGERVHIDRLGEWGRHLPTVDDVLDLPIRQGRPVQLFSSYGVTTVVPPDGAARRLGNRIRIAWRYADLAALRLAVLRVTEKGEQGAYVHRLWHDYGIRVAFQPYGGRDGGQAGRPEAPHATGVFVEPEPAPSTPAMGAHAAVAAFAPASVAQHVRDWVDLNGYYFLSAKENNQVSLVLFAGTFVAFLFTRAHVIRRRFDRARDAIPMRIGGWGTRGKSGTERLKAGLFHGLGYRVFSKTSGCEAMFIHAVPGQKAEEIFLFRPYDKASIWEQHAVVAIAAGLDTEVFLWECMALNPRYVELLEHSWMRDEIATLTNAYPDHEDIQGPAGFDVAEVISRFIPYGATLVTSEDNFLPMFSEIARERDTACISVAPEEADLIADDLLDLFPYREHPRNVALVARLAEELGLDRDLAIATMAEHVVPDLGVLMEYPTVRWRGRRLTFVNGMSANERAGFLGNWTRMGFVEEDLDTRPGRVLATVINNRADRLSRSEVFSRIMVNDVSVDRHVLIGTNIKGLMHYVRAALTQYLEESPVVTADARSVDPTALRDRLARHMDRLRIPGPQPELFLVRLRRYAAGAQAVVRAERLEELERAVERALASDGGVSLEDVRGELEDGFGLGPLLAEALTPAPEVDEGLEPETLETPSPAEAVEHALDLLARMVVRARLHTALDELVQRGIDEESASTFQSRFAQAYRELYEAHLVPILDPDLKGDAVIDALARALPPGTDVHVMGAQNIKGTGLDFVYRWVAVQTVFAALERLASDRPAERAAALDELETHTDWGLADVARCRAALAEEPPGDADGEERVRRERLAERLDELHGAKRAALASRTQTRDVWAYVGEVVEATVDYLDGVARQRRSQRITEDLIAGRIAHGRAALEMRALVARQKGGWAAKALRQRFGN